MRAQMQRLTLFFTATDATFLVLFLLRESCRTHGIYDNLKI